MLVAALLEGRVKSLAIVAEIIDTDGSPVWIQDYELDMEEHTSDLRGFVGAMTMLHKEVLDDASQAEFILDMLDGDDGDGDD